jgi:hypothetical protein
MNAMMESKIIAIDMCGHDFFVIGRKSENPSCHPSVNPVRSNQ